MSRGKIGFDCPCGPHPPIQVVVSGVAVTMEHSMHSEVEQRLAWPRNDKDWVHPPPVSRADGDKCVAGPHHLAEADDRFNVDVDV